jgi:hypothetical protein
VKLHTRLVTSQKHTHVVAKSLIFLFKRSNPAIVVDIVLSELIGSALLEWSNDQNADERSTTADHNKRDVSGTATLSQMSTNLESGILFHSIS